VKYDHFHMSPLINMHITRKPQFDALAATSGHMRYPNDDIILFWSARNALFVKTSFSSRLLPVKGKLEIPREFRGKIKVTAFGYLGVRREEVIISQSALQTIPKLSATSDAKPISWSPKILPDHFPTRLSSFNFIGSSLEYKPMDIKVDLAVQLKQTEKLAVKIELPEIDIFK